MANIQVLGIPEKVRKIGLFEMERKQAAIVLVKKTATGIQKEGKSLAPASPTGRKKSKGKPGDLKRSIRPKYMEGGLSATVVPRKPKGAHRHLVEYGTRQRKNKKGANRGKMPKKPFMSIAERHAEGRYNKELERIFNCDETI
ncbi:phage protein, HK97 gp10 family [Paenibacillus larvae subsp. larvae]|uniref:Phage protein, HK97 gp10 family n=1 Tax=Paenibacillus larvae subsp. larvae TaxID=147375 RepID=A0A2L1TWS0_9BACL|nr:HK97-gp10 family putative phage morphogenesis protein [Paenibacillus larvae]AQT85692.1 hypothetical protein B1222_16795 [Paenibacillus larvae subsp. pulvifaciens]AVF25094.1 phage protein, HK97 gp10 family [Paenibacillus larvae subsp. larvae]AVF29858.1 phage protein, HK97 gp10 family [Paenibacillus larvae subsp. larvae]MBH0342270.1 hypothetical protein [Paenibacillus larvae]MCY7520667.1 hypothetical protein [Paenibacillus larvae]